MGNTHQELCSAERASAQRALRKAKMIECEKLKQGYAYVKATSSMEVLVPCDEEGKPTKEGEDILKRYRDSTKKYGYYLEY